MPVNVKMHTNYPEDTYPRVEYTFAESSTSEILAMVILESPIKALWMPTEEAAIYIKNLGGKIWNAMLMSTHREDSLVDKNRVRADGKNLSSLYSRGVFVQLPRNRKGSFLDASASREVKLARITNQLLTPVKLKEKKKTKS